MTLDNTRKKIPMPRSRYLDDAGQPFDPVYGSYVYWPRELKIAQDNYCAYLDRLWARDDREARRRRRN